jgi:hypothetical protein
LNIAAKFFGIIETFKCVWVLYLDYCRGDFFCHPDNLVEIYCFS